MRSPPFIFRKNKSFFLRFKHCLALGPSGRLLVPQTRLFNLYFHLRSSITTGLNTRNNCVTSFPQLSRLYIISRWFVKDLLQVQNSVIECNFPKMTNILEKLAKMLYLPKLSVTYFIKIDQTLLTDEILCLSLYVIEIW